MVLALADGVLEISVTIGAVGLATIGALILRHLEVKGRRNRRR